MSNELEVTGDDDGWSVLYAPQTTLQPIACHACGNVFAAEASACPWCGRLVGRAAPIVEADEVELGSSASLLIPPRPTPDPIAAASVSDGWMEPTSGQQVRRWAGVLVAAGVLLAIATGVTVRSRDRGDTGTAAPTTPAARAAASTAGAATTAATTTPTTTPATTARATAPATTAPGPTTVAPAPTTVAPTTAPAATTTVARSATTTDAGLVLSDGERRALNVARALNDAIVRKDWNTVRSLAPTNTATDATYERFWGAVQAATVVPARVIAGPANTYEVFVGVVSVTGTGSATSSALVCGRYTVDGVSQTVSAVATRELRKQSGTVEGAAVAGELRDTCRDPGI